jgi:hypothetical protein
MWYISAIMLKRLAILGLLVVGLGCWARSQVPRDRSQQKQPAQRKNDKTPDLAPSCLCNIQIQKAPTEQAGSSKQKPSSYPWGELLAPANIPNWLLFLAAGWAGAMALKTLLAIEKQVNLQSAAMEQWIEVVNWKSQIAPLERGGDYLLVEVEIFNKTSFPLTLKTAEIDFTNTADAVKRTYFAGEDRFLAPNQPHKVVVAIKIDKDQIAAFSSGGIGILVNGRFLHVGVLQKPKFQPLSGLLICRKSETILESDIDMNPKDHTDKDQT